MCLGRSFVGQTVDSFGIGVPATTAYVRALSATGADILALSELPFEPKGQSILAADLGRALGLVSTSFLQLDSSWLDDGFSYGLGLATSWQIVEERTLILKAPLLTAEGPDGKPWRLHDKAIQWVLLKRDDKLVGVANLHLFPAHYFGHKLTDPPFEESLAKLAEFLVSATPAGLPSLIVGDFNDRGFEASDLLHHVLPRRFEEAIRCGTLLGRSDQVDHVFYSVDTLEKVEAEAFACPSDHMALRVRLQLRNS